MESSGIQPQYQVNFESLIQPAGNLATEVSKSSLQGAYSLAKTTDLSLGESAIKGLTVQPFDDALVSSRNLNLTTSMTSSAKTDPVDLLGSKADPAVGTWTGDDLLSHQANGINDSFSQVASDLNQLESLFNTAQTLNQVKALDHLQQFKPTDLKDSLNFGLDSLNNQKSKLGQGLGNSANTGFDTNTPDFKDPLNGHRNNRPKSTVIGAGAIPGIDSLVSQDRDAPVRTRTWGSEDGRVTYRHDTYADGSRRVERQIHLEDGSTRTNSMTWGSDGQVESFGSSRHDQTTGTTISETTRFNPDGSKVTYVIKMNADGEVTSWNTEDTNTDDTSKAGGGLVKTSENPDETGSRYGGSVNPFTGQYWGPQRITSGNLINPGKQETTPTAPQLNVDQRSLVINPSLEVAASPSEANQTRLEPRVLVNPGRL